MPVTLTSMLLATVGMALLACWHLTIAWASWLLTERIVAASFNDGSGRSIKSNGPPATGSLLIWLAIDLVLTCSLATFAGLLRFNFAGMYLMLALATLLIASLPRPHEAAAALKRLGALLVESISSLPSWLIAAGGLLFGPLLLLNIRPVHDNDSLYAMTFVIDWMRNVSTPYFGYPTGIAFWEIGYLPSLVMTRSTAFLWIHALKAIWLLAIGAYCFARQLRIKKEIAAALAATCLLTYHYWAYFGVGTLKNDAAVAAGFMLLVISGVHALRTSPSWWSAVAAAAGVSLLNAKFSGPFIGVAVVAIWIVAALGDGKKLIRLAAFTPLAIAIVMLSSGHYYLANIATHGAPFHPVKITIFGWNLGGQSYFPDTAILDHWSDLETWRQVFFPATIVSAAGIYFPFFMLLAIGIGGGLLIVTGIRIVTRKSFDRSLLFIGLAVLMGWALYFRSPWSAGSVHDRYQWLRTMVSLRYALGVVTLSEVLVIAAALRLRAPNWFVWLVIAGQALSRVIVLGVYFVDQESLATYPVTMAIVIAAGLVWSGVLLWLSRAKPKRGRAAWALAIGVVVIFAASFGLYALNLPRSNPTYRDAFAMMRNLPPSRVAMIVVPEVDTGIRVGEGATGKLPTWNQETGEFERFQFRYSYPVIGDRFQHQASWMRVSELSVEAVQSYDYLVFLQPPWCYSEPTQFADLVDKVESLGFEVVVRSGHELVAKRRDSD